MSQKITGKNLHYDQSLPPFLARLKGQHAAAAGDGPDPILASRRRPAAQARSASEEAEDLPVVVDDEGHVVDGASVGADGTVTGPGGRGGGREGEEGGQEEEGKGEEEEEEKERVAAIGGSKKRKVGRIVGAGAEDEDDDVSVSATTAAAAAAAKKKKNLSGARAPGERDSDALGEDAGDHKSKGPPVKGKKKAKKIKLSFGDDGD